jgi:hypothetical protein
VSAYCESWLKTNKPIACQPLQPVAHAAGKPSVSFYNGENQRDLTTYNGIRNLTHVACKRANGELLEWSELVNETSAHGRDSLLKTLWQIIFIAWKSFVTSSIVTSVTLTLLVCNAVHHLSCHEFTIIELSRFLLVRLIFMELFWKQTVLPSGKFGFPNSRAYNKLLRSMVILILIS